MCNETPIRRVCCEVASQDYIIRKKERKRIGSYKGAGKKKNLENSSHRKISLFLMGKLVKLIEIADTRYIIEQFHNHDMILK